jgi:hypothetical protein
MIRAQARHEHRSQQCPGGAGYGQGPIGRLLAFTTVGTFTTAISFQHTHSATVSTMRMIKKGQTRDDTREIRRAHELEAPSGR